MKRLIALAAVVGLALAACGSEGEEPSGGDQGGSPAACASPTALATSPSLPPGFPTPGEVTLSGVETIGPSLRVTGRWNGDLDEAFEGFKDAFEQANFDVTFSEKEEDDAEVSFAGGGTTGQVKMTVPCEGQTDLRITIRPA
ncbi:MAG TPA: hypothetical protein VKA30_13220 [Actinomycetota bacterium]|nr:hypothetical protein [Actinomycetota bacterium]